MHTFFLIFVIWKHRHYDILEILQQKIPICIPARKAISKNEFIDYTVKNFNLLLIQAILLQSIKFEFNNSFSDLQQTVLSAIWN